MPSVAGMRGKIALWSQPLFQSAATKKGYCIAQSVYKVFPQHFGAVNGNFPRKFCLGFANSVFLFLFGPK